MRWKSVIGDFYGAFKKELDVAEKEIQKVEFEEEPTGETCEKCGKPMVIKHGRFGAFAACTGYPECKNTKPIVKCRCEMSEVRQGHRDAAQQNRDEFFMDAAVIRTVHSPTGTSRLIRSALNAARLLVEKKTKRT